MNKKRIVITGVGVVSPIGIGKADFWKNLFAGKSGVKPITLFDTASLKVKVGGEAGEFNPQEILGESRLMDLDRATLLLLCASKLCLDDVGVKIDEGNTGRTGVAVGTTFGSLYSVSKYNRESLTEGPRFANPSIFPSTVGNSPASRVSIQFKIKGFNTTISTGMSAGLDALEYAADQITLDRADHVLAGAVEDFSPVTFMGFYKLDYLSGLNGSQPCSCPFDKRRNGVVFAEGATVFMIEDTESARKNSRHIYAEIKGVGSAFDPARFYRYNPAGEGMQRAMRMALDDAGIEPDDIDAIFANANATRGADAVETLAIKNVFGDYAGTVPVTAIKAMTGETFSNSGSLSLAAALAALDKNMVPLLLNYEQEDANCDLHFVLHKPLEKKITNVLVNTFGPNGGCTSVVLGKINK